MKIIFFGTPEFAVASLTLLIENHFEVSAVVTSPDQPAGRGLKTKIPAVKEFALQHKLKILQPENLKHESFLNELTLLHADLFVIVAFRMLPQVVWKMPPLGSINLHASLLPQYRGAAPINRAIMNGETETGLTTFFLQHQIDTGKIILQETISISENETAGLLHYRMMIEGAALLLKTVQQIENGKAIGIEQLPFDNDITALKHAPKIFKDDCKINWSKSNLEVHNLIRGLSPYPAAFATLRSNNGEQFSVKIFSAKKENEISNPGKIISDGKTFIKVGCGKNAILIDELQLSGKNKMNTKDFLRGFRLDDSWHFE